MGAHRLRKVLQGSNNYQGPQEQVFRAPLFDAYAVSFRADKAHFIEWLVT